MAASDKNARSLTCAIAVLGSVAALPAGCHKPRAPEPQFRPAAGTSADSVLHDPFTTVVEESTTRYESDAWALTVKTADAWQVEPEPASTLRLARIGDDAPMTLTLHVYAIRNDMPIIPFLASIALWRVEEDRQRVEPVFDEALEVWRGYAMDEDGETYFGFWAVGDRGYVLEGAAVEGVLKADAVAEFERVLADFEHRPRRGLTPAGGAAAP